MIFGCSICSYAAIFSVGICLFFDIGEIVVAMTIRNKTVEAEIREVGRETGEGPSALIGRLVGDERRRLREVERLEIARRRHAMRELLAMLPRLTDAQKAEMDRITEDMFDENGLPK
jgi:hypothetical protein